MDNTKSNRGSEWTKWDLHVHTPMSIYHRFGTNDETTWQNYLTDLENLSSEFSVVGVNDYLFLNGYERLLLEQSENGRCQNLTFFPVVEFRIEKFAGIDFGPLKRINLHVIFSNFLSVETIKSQFLNTLEQSYFLSSGEAWTRAITPESVSELGNQIKANVPETELGKYGTDLTEGFNNLNISEDKFFDSLKKDVFKGKHLIAIGKTEWADLKWTDASIATKKSIINRANVVFTAAKSVEDFDSAKRQLTAQGVNDLLLDCSDAHYLSTSTDKDRIGNCFTWIKSNPTFEGLKQIIYEPDQRLKIQLNEPDLKEDKLVIDEVRFISLDNKFTPEPIKLNKNLNVIIGGKSSGKSILLYNIARTLLSDRSILKTESGQYRYQFDSFDFIVKMCSGLEESINRIDDTPSILSEIKYIPQNYLSKLAEPENKKGNELLKLVRGLLLEQDEYKSKYQNFIGVVKSNDSKRELMINNYFEIKGKIGILSKDLIGRGSEDVLNLSVKTNEEHIKKLKESIGLKPEEIAQYNLYNEELQRIEIEINKIKADHSKITTFNTDAKNILTELLSKKNLVLNSLENEQVRALYTNEFDVINQAVNTFESLSQAIKLNDQNVFLNLENPFHTLSQAQRLRKRELLELLKPLVNNEIVKKQIDELEKLVVADKQKLSLIAQLKIEILSNQKALEEEKNKIFALYQENYGEYEKIILEVGERANKLKDDNLEIAGKAKFNFPRFRKRMLDISDGRRGSYNSYTVFNEDKSAVTEYKVEELMAELKTAFESIVKGEYVINSKSDIKNAIKFLLDDYFFDYWEVIYDDDTLDKMSTGKASFVILMLIVGLSSSKAPILIDQPEDNLDNRSITKDLVSYLRNKKLERQIILVTHNPNVVVNADAENIIVANQRGQNNKSTSPYVFDYINGSLEETKKFDSSESNILLSMGIREHIADIVEGGKEAFKKREKKYGFRNII